MASPVFSFVIDADIARSSGLSEHPVSSGSRMLLESVASLGHKVAMCPVLRQEWKKHKSNFSTKWLASMVARRKIVFVTPSGRIKCYIKDNVVDGREKEVALKDSHLIDAALEADKIIASNDNVAREVFCTYSGGNGEIGTVLWFNAVTDKEVIYERLMRGGYIPSDYYLLSKA